MAVSKWIASARGTSGLISILTTELNALANNAGVVTAVVENSTSLDQYADFELVVTYGTAPTADTTVDLYIVRTIDGTNYEDATATRPTPEFVGSFVLDNVTTAQRKIVRGVMLPPISFKLLIVNKAGQAMAATGNTLRGDFYNQQVI
jgi:hypothetical protein